MFLQWIKKMFQELLQSSQKTLVANSYFSKIAGFYRSSHWRCSVKKVILERRSQNSHENTCVRYSILIKLQVRGCKKETLAQVFLRTPFLQNHSRGLLLILTFQKWLPLVFYEKRCSWKFLKLHRKTTVVWKIFKKTFSHNTSGQLLLAFPSNFTKMGHCHSVLKNSEEYPLSRSSKRRSTIQVYHFFHSSINFQCVFTGLHCQKQPPE